MKNDQNARRSAQLGMPFGTANGKLRKILLFDLVRKTGQDNCYRCGLKIETIEEFSIEHKKAWLNVDPALFWDLDNIAYSHLTCNVAAATRPPTLVCYKCKKNPPRRDGNGWAKRCNECSTQDQRELRAKKQKS